LNGTQSVYRPNPDTGAIEESQVKAPAGQFFKNLLAGMLVGGAAASAPARGEDGGGFFGGLSRGGSAVMQNRQQQDQANFQRAETQQKLTDEHNSHAAMVAHENIETSQILHNMHLADEKSIEEHNAASRAYQKSLTDAGGQPAQLNIGGKVADTTDGNSFAQAYTKDPSIARAPDGYQRHFISTTGGLSELHFDGDHWTDDSGNPVNMGGNISIRAYDLPTTTFKTPRRVSGKDVNAARRQKIVDPNGTYMVSPEAMSGLYTLGAKDANEDARSAASNARAAKAAKDNKTFTAIESRKAAALAKAENIYWTARNKSADPQTPDPELDAQLNEAKQNAQNAYEDEIRAAGGNPQHYEYGAIPHAQAPQPNQTPPPGATMKVPGADGKMHWSDGKKDLGLVK
jgi:hypothetical protein